MSDDVVTTPDGEDLPASPENRARVRQLWFEEHARADADAPRDPIGDSDPQPPAPDLIDNRETEAALLRRAADVTHRERELAAALQQLESDRATQRNIQHALDDERDRLDNLQTCLDARSDALNQQECDLQIRSANVFQRESNVSRRESNVSQRQSNVPASPDVPGVSFVSSQPVSSSSKLSSQYQQESR